MLPELLKKCTEKELYYHAIPDNFWEMDYNQFLEKRRSLISHVIKKGVEKIFQKD